MHKVGIEIEGHQFSSKTELAESGTGNRVEASVSATQRGDELTSDPALTSKALDDIEKRTRDAIGNSDILPLRDGRLHLKHITSVYGSIAEDDLSRNVFRVIDKRTEQEVTFTSVDALIAAGWVID